jgi:ketosteroid isomerase-like protein
MPDDLAQRNVAQMQRIYAEYAAGNRAPLLDALSEDVSWHSVGCGDLPWSGLHRGRAGVGDYFAALGANVSVLGYEVEQVIAEGEWICVLGTIRVRYGAGGGEHEYAKADIFRLRDGRIVEFREFYDTAKACAEFGARYSGLRSESNANPL